MEKKYPYKSIKFNPADHKVIDDLAKEIQAERGGKGYLPPVVMEAITFFKTHRNNPYITPGGKND